MSRGIGRAENEARRNGGSCRYCGVLHYEQHVAKRCEEKYWKKRDKKDAQN